MFWLSVLAATVGGWASEAFPPLHAGIGYPRAASDRRTLYFSSTRPVALGEADLYVTTRMKAGKVKD